MRSTEAILEDIKRLSERVTVLERLRTRRGYCNKKTAASYLGVSRETLRLLEVRGTGPVMNADGSYAFDQLDLYKETRTAA
jgi:hypothetical protein